MWPQRHYRPFAGCRLLRQKKAAKYAGDVMPVIEDLKANGATSLRQIADGLNQRGITTARGGEWSAVQVQRLTARPTETISTYS